MYKKEGERMSRTGEKVLIVIATIFNFLALALTTVMMVGLNSVIKEPTFAEEFIKDANASAEVTDTLTLEEFQEALDFVTPYVNSIGWIIIITFVIAIGLGIAALVMINKKTKNNTAGALLIVAGVLSGVLSLTAILYYIPAIMLFVRKPKPLDQITNPDIKNDVL